MLDDGIGGDDRRRARDGHDCGDLRRAASADEERLEPRREAAEVEAPKEPAPRTLRGLLEPRCQRAPRSEDQRLDRALRDLELRGDLAIRETLPLAEQDRASLALGHLLEHVLQADQLVGRAGGGGRQLLDGVEVGGRLDAAATPARAAAREADVVCDLEEPGCLELGHDAALQAPERVQERALDGVFGLLARAELVEAVAKDLVRVLLVERLGQAGLGGTRPLDPSCTAYGRNGCQIFAPGGRSGSLGGSARARLGSHHVRGPLPGQPPRWGLTQCSRKT